MQLLARWRETNSFPAFKPARPSLPAERRAATAHLHTSIGAAQNIPELHVRNRQTEVHTPLLKSQTSVCVPLLFLHFLVALYADTYKGGKTPAY